MIYIQHFVHRDLQSQLHFTEVFESLDALDFRAN